MANDFGVDKNYAEQSAKLIACFINNTEKGDCLSTIFAKSVYQYIEDFEQAEHVIQVLADNFEVPINMEKIKKKRRRYLDNHLCSLFGSKQGTCTFIIDTMLKTGRYTVNEIAQEAQVNSKIVTRRIKVLQNQGREITEFKSKVGVV